MLKACYMCLRVCFHYRLVVKPGTIQLLVRQPCDKLIEEMTVRIMELQKEVQFLKAELLRIVGEPDRLVSLKGLITIEDLQALAQKSRNLRREEKLKALTRAQENQAWISSVGQSKSTENWKNSKRIS